MTKNFIQRLHCRRHGIRRGGLVGDHSIRCRQIERAALGFHGFQGFRAGGKGPSAAHQQIFQRPVDKEHDAVGVERPEVCRVFDHAADSSASGTVEEEADQRLESLNTLLAALDAAGMSADVTRIEFADVDEMAFLYQDRISVWLGTLNELEYKLKLAKHVLLNEDGKGCAATDTGKLDFTHISMSSTRKFTFAQGEPELPSGYILPEPVEETPAEEGVTGETAEGTATDGTAPAEGEAAADAAAETPTDTAAAPADPEAGQTAQPTPAEGTTPAAGDANQPQTTQ